MYHDLYRYHDIEAPVGVMLFCSIRAYIAATKVKTVLQPLHLDASEPWEKWAGLPRGACDVIVAINLLQYSSFKTVEVGLTRQIIP